MFEFPKSINVIGLLK